MPSVIVNLILDQNKDRVILMLFDKAWSVCFLWLAESWALQWSSRRKQVKTPDAIAKLVYVFIVKIFHLL